MNERHGALAHRSRPGPRFGYACWPLPAPWDTFAATRPSSQITLGGLVLLEQITVDSDDDDMLVCLSAARCKNHDYGVQWPRHKIHLDYKIRELYKNYEIANSILQPMI